MGSTTEQLLAKLERYEVRLNESFFQLTEFFDSYAIPARLYIQVGSSYFDISSFCSAAEQGDLGVVNVDGGVCNVRVIGFQRFHEKDVRACALDFLAYSSSRGITIETTGLLSERRTEIEGEETLILLFGGTVTIEDKDSKVIQTCKASGEKARLSSCGKYRISLEMGSPRRHLCLITYAECT